VGGKSFKIRPEGGWEIAFKTEKQNKKKKNERKKVG
jgi:hypothetical protein